MHLRPKLLPSQLWMCYRERIPSNVLVSLPVGSRHSAEPTFSALQLKLRELWPPLLSLSNLFDGQPIDLDAQQFCCDRSRFCAWRMQDVCEACSLRITAAAQQLQRCGSRCHYHSSTRRRTQLQLDQLPHADCTARRRCGGVSVFVVGQTCGGARENIITVFSS